MRVCIDKCKFICAILLFIVASTGYTTRLAFAAEPQKIFYVRPVPDNDDPYLQQGSDGIKQAAQMYQMQATTLASQADRAGRQKQLENAIRLGANIIVMIGYEFRELLDTVPRTAPNVRFVMLEQCIANPPPNLLCISFRESEASYLAGMEAALVSASGKIGVIGAVKSPLKQKPVDAFIAGAKSVKPDADLSHVVWIEGSQPFNDTARAEALAKNMLADGVDIIYAAAGSSNNGVFKALAGNTKARAIGSYVNQCPKTGGKVIDNMQVHGDTAISLAVAAILGGSTATRIEYGLKEGAVSLTGISTDAAYSDCDILRQRAVLQKLREASQAIIKGKLKVE
ncbi:BMP family ABC transporter substrate-binding protein [Undibacterium sp. Di27W]|uniref:BMP family ABC transporter substrate-binding protein n=1 Tax=Undibacterium sp. Di27W TaxID=3413036 RepID=UPI003BF07922